MALPRLHRFHRPTVVLLAAGAGLAAAAFAFERYGCFHILPIATALAAAAVPLLGLLWLARDRQAAGQASLAVARSEGKDTELHWQRTCALLQKLAARQDKEREQERKRIAREVYDELGQILVTLRIKLKLVAERLGDDHAALAKELESSSELLDASISLVRGVASELRPNALDLGIDAALEWLAERFTQQSAIPCALNLGELDAGMDDEFVTAIFRILQETLGNIARHAQATAVEISFGKEGPAYILEVSDDGAGRDPGAAGDTALAFAWIQTRAQRLGGQAAIFSAPGSGTRLEVRIPAPVGQSLQD